MDSQRYEAAAEAILAHSDELFSALQTRLDRTLRQHTPAQTLTFDLVRNGRVIERIEPGVSLRFAHALFSVTSGRPLDGCDVVPAIATRIEREVEDVVRDFFGSEAVIGAVSEALLQELRRSGAAQQAYGDVFSENQEWLGRELRVLMDSSVTGSGAGWLIDATADQLHHFFQSAVGKKVLLVVAKTASSTAGKVLIVKGIQLAVAKLMASAAFRSALVAVIKKVGIGILVKTAIGKALLVLLAALGLAKIPVAWIILPAIAAFITYEYKTFPSKLADKLPPRIVQDLRERFDEINLSISRVIVDTLLAHLVDELTALRST